MRTWHWAILVCVCSLPLGCSKGMMTTRGSSNASKAIAHLTQRAERLWQAKQAEQWATVYEYFEPEERSKIVRVEFEEWSSKNEPFRVHTYKIIDVQAENDMGWVIVEYQSTIRQFPTVEPRTTTQIEKWRKTAGEWYPVPKTELDRYPEVPSRRNAAQEAVLRQRFDQAWAHRKARNWAALYEFSDPKDRDFVSLPMYEESESQFIYLDVTVRWVEVIGEYGQVQVSYYHRVADQSMEKLPPRDAIVTERWILRDGVWYRDLKSS